MKIQCHDLMYHEGAGYVGVELAAGLAEAPAN